MVTAYTRTHITLAIRQILDPCVCDCARTMQQLIPLVVCIGFYYLYLISMALITIEQLHVLGQTKANSLIGLL